MGPSLRREGALTHTHTHTHTHVHTLLKALSEVLDVLGRSRYSEQALSLESFLPNCLATALDNEWDIGPCGLGVREVRVMSGVREGSERGGWEGEGEKEGRREVEEGV